jgi:dUTP pyrophosphatase
MAASVPYLKIRLAHAQAVLPSKAHPDDVGYDLTLVQAERRVDSVTTLFDTGVQVQLPPGYYAEVVARSSLIKTGHIVTNGVGIIDPGYTGSIKVSLTRVDPTCASVVLPYKAAQLIIRRQYGAERVVQVTDFFAATDRGAGGFGSSG